VRRVRLETRARRAIPAGRVEKVRKPHVQQESIAIQTRILEKSVASRTNVLGLNPKLRKQLRQQSSANLVAVDCCATRPEVAQSTQES
jgi:hypothetical protein